MKSFVWMSHVIGGLLLCLSVTAPAQWCDPDVVTARVDGSTITVYHEKAEWNCCYYISFVLVENGEMLDLYEIPGGDGCWCTCCFDLIATIEDVAPGTYLVRTIDGETEEVLGQVWVTVEGGSGITAGLGSSEQSPCGGWATSVPDVEDDEEPGSVTWGLIKAMYR